MLWRFLFLFLLIVRFNDVIFRFMHWRTRSDVPRNTQWWLTWEAHIKVHNKHWWCNDWCWIIYQLGGVACPNPAVFQMAFTVFICPFVIWNWGVSCLKDCKFYVRYLFTWMMGDKPHLYFHWLRAIIHRFNSPLSITHIHTAHRSSDGRAARVLCFTERSGALRSSSLLL